MAQTTKPNMDLALELFSLHHELKQDPHNVLSWVAQAGFRSVEIAGFSSLGAEEFADELCKQKLECIGIHCPSIELHDAESVAHLAQWCTKMAGVFDCTMFVFFRDPLSLFEKDRTRMPEREYYEQLGERLDELCRQLEKCKIHKRKEGKTEEEEVEIRVAYHCYDADMAPLPEDDKQTPESGLHILLRKVTRKNFSLQLDTYFLMIAHRPSSTLIQDTLALAKGRVTSVHVSDIDATGRCVAIGKGLCPWEKLVPEILAQDESIRWILELDPDLSQTSGEKDKEKAKDTDATKEESKQQETSTTEEKDEKAEADKDTEPDGNKKKTDEDLDAIAYSRAYWNSNVERFQELAGSLGSATMRQATEINAIPPRSRSDVANPHALFLTGLAEAFEDTIGDAVTDDLFNAGPHQTRDWAPVEWEKLPRAEYYVNERCDERGNKTEEYYAEAEFNKVYWPIRAKRSKQILMVQGGKGVGKSTFLQYFFRYFLPN